MLRLFSLCLLPLRQLDVYKRQILKIANALECSLDDLAGRNNPALEALRRLADHADGMYQIFAEVEHLLYPNFMMQRENNK